VGDGHGQGRGGCRGNEREDVALVRNRNDRVIDHF
jgi:hypothetical protein